MEYKKRQRFSSLRQSKNTIKNTINVKGKKSFFGKLALVIFGLFVVSGAAYATNLYISLKDVIKPNKSGVAEGLQGDLNLSTLKGEGEGRVNILLLGTGDAGHDGENLTDTIIVASIDPKTNDAVMLGIPRDLYVKIPGYGYDRINSVAYYAKQNNQENPNELLKTVVSEVIDQPIHYYAMANFTGLKSVVDKLGGVNIYNSEAIADSEYPCDDNPYKSCGFKLDKGYYEMDGALALKYARCRKGSCGNDYGRSRRQLDVLIAIRDRAVQLDNILNPAKTSELVGVLGQNVSTDLSLDEMRKLVVLIRRIDSKSVASRVLDSKNQALVTDKMINSSSVVVPTDGIEQYGSIQSFVSSLFVDGYIKTENSQIRIESPKEAQASAYALSSKLRSIGYNIVDVDTSIKSSDSSTKILDYSNGSANYTLRYLQNRLGVDIQKQSSKNTNQKDVVISIGRDYEFKNNN